LKAFLKKHGRFPKKGELGRKRTVHHMARKGKGKRKGTRRRYFKRARGRVVKSRSIAETIGTAWLAWNGFIEPTYIAVKDHWKVEAYLRELAYRDMFLDGGSLAEGKLKINTAGSIKTYGPFVGVKVAKHINSRYVHLPTKVSKRWRIL